LGQWRELLRERAGVRLNENQKQFLQSQVTMRMREVGEQDIASYFSHISDASEGRLEWSILIDRLVVKETSFFRHQPSLNYVCAHLQNKIVQQNIVDNFDIWSVGCATGEEAYTLAMLVNEAFELAKIDPYFGVLATDISRAAISVARSGQFSARKLSFVPSSFRFKYFTELGRDMHKFDHELIDKMCFSTANVLHTDGMPNLLFDVIYCQNMLVYFDQDLRHNLLDSMVNRLKPSGLLVIGLGEVTSWKHEAVERVNRADVQVYQKHANGPVSE